MEVSTYPVSELDEETWGFLPEPVREISQTVSDNARTTVEEVCLGIRSGVASNADQAFVVTPEIAEEKDLEDELLFPIIRGKHTRRWMVKWDNDIAIYPYDENENFVDLEKYPNIKDHLDEYEEDLKDRYCVTKGNKGIYEYDGPRPKSVYEGDFKIAVPDMATENHFSYSNGYDCFKNTDYVLTFSDSIVYSEKGLLGLLNSSISELMIKSESPFLNDRYYRYKTQYIESIPLPEPSDEIEELVDEILQLEQLNRKVAEFPHSYIEEYDGMVDYIDYEWETRRYPVNAEVEEIDDERFAVTAGISDEITDPRMEASTKEMREQRAKYVHSAVDGQNVKKGEEISIPIPRDDDDVLALLDEWETDKQVAEETTIEELEAEIDETVYDLFNLTDEEREVIEEYLEVF